MSNVLSMDNKKTNAEEKLEKFVTKNRKILLVVVVVLLAAAAGTCGVLGAIDISEKKGVAAVDSIEYTMVAKSEGLSESDASARLNKAMDALTPYISKKGIVGVRANMLAAEIASQNGDKAKALEYTLAASESGKKSYTYALCMFNAGVYSEDLGNNENALNYYKSASEAKEFYLAPHAVFSCGRVCEAMGKVEDASVYYKKCVDTYSADSWANLSRSRLIALKADGKVE